MGTTKQVMKRRKVKAVIRNHKPNKTKVPELYFHHLLMLYYPWRNERDLLGSHDQTYASKFYEPNIQAIVEQNRKSFEPDGDVLAEALEILRTSPGNTTHSYDALNDQENADIQSEMHDDSPPEDSFNEQLPSHLSTSHRTDHQSNLGIASYNQPSEISDDDLREHVRSLNSRHRCAYDIVLTWCRNKIKT